VEKAVKSRINFVFASLAAVTCTVPYVLDGRCTAIELVLFLVAAETVVFIYFHPTTSTITSHVQQDYWY
jgi:hypothetical protein